MQLKSPIFKIGFVFILFCLFSCAASKKITSESAVSQLTKDFIELMIDGTANTEAGEKFIPPSYWKEHNIKPKDIIVNNYSPVAYEIESHDKKENLVTATIWGEDKNWTHRIIFKVIEEKGKLYFQPSRQENGYIDPWHSVDAYINRN